MPPVGRVEGVAAPARSRAIPVLGQVDEPLGALAALIRIEMQQLLERIWITQKFTAVLVTNDVAEAVALADRVVVISDGRIAVDLEVPVARPRGAVPSSSPVWKARSWTGCSARTDETRPTLLPAQTPERFAHTRPAPPPRLVTSPL